MGGAGGDLECSFCFLTACHSGLGGCWADVPGSFWGVYPQGSCYVLSWLLFPHCIVRLICCGRGLRSAQGPNLRCGWEGPLSATEGPWALKLAVASEPLELFLALVFLAFHILTQALGNFNKTIKCTEGALCLPGL